MRYQIVEKIPNFSAASCKPKVFSDRSVIHWTKQIFNKNESYCELLFDPILLNSICIWKLLSTCYIVWVGWKSSCWFGVPRVPKTMVTEVNGDEIENANKLPNQGMVRNDDCVWMENGEHLNVMISITDCRFLNLGTLILFWRSRQLSPLFPV